MPENEVPAHDRLETMQEAIARLEQRGYAEAFRAVSGGRLEASGHDSIEPESLVIEETVRFEGSTDPQDEAVLFALRSHDGQVKGTFVAGYGPHVEPDCAEAIQRLTRAERRARQAAD